MRVQVQLFATLAAFLPPGGYQGVATLEVAEDSTVRDLVQCLGLPTDLERVTLVNGGDAPPDRALQQGDVVADPSRSPNLCVYTFLFITVREQEQEPTPTEQIDGPSQRHLF